MTINDVIMFSEKENITLTQDEYLKILNTIKNHWEELINNSDMVKKYLNDNFNNQKSEQIFKLFLKYQKKYSSYL